MSLSCGGGCCFSKQLSIFFFLIFGKNVIFFFIIKNSFLHFQLFQNERQLVAIYY